MRCRMEVVTDTREAAFAMLKRRLHAVLQMNPRIFVSCVVCRTSPVLPSLLLKHERLLSRPQQFMCVVIR